MTCAGEPLAASACAEPIAVESDPVLERLLPRFVANRRRDVGTIIQTLDQEDFASIQEMGHNLKGTGRSYGCDGISEIGRALEEAAKAGDVAEIRRQAAALEDYLRRVKVPAPTSRTR
jgi:hypothetical protein